GSVVARDCPRPNRATSAMRRSSWSAIGFMGSGVISSESRSPGPPGAPGVLHLQNGTKRRSGVEQILLAYRRQIVGELVTRKVGGGQLGSEGQRCQVHLTLSRSRDQIQG